MSIRLASNVIHLGEIGPSASTGNAADKRRSPRRRIFKGAWAAFNDRHCSIPCTVRDISETGARLLAEGTVNVPDTFELIVDLDGTEANCEVVWRKGKEIGVKFIGAPRMVTPRRIQTVTLLVPERPATLRRRPKTEEGI